MARFDRDTFWVLSGKLAIQSANFSSILPCDEAMLAAFAARACVSECVRAFGGTAALSAQPAAAAAAATPSTSSSPAPSVPASALLQPSLARWPVYAPLGATPTAGWRSEASTCEGDRHAERAPRGCRRHRQPFCLAALPSPGVLGPQRTEPRWGRASSRRGIASHEGIACFRGRLSALGTWGRSPSGLVRQDSGPVRGPVVCKDFAPK